MVEEPIDFDTYRLDRRVKDHELLASMILFASANPGSESVLVTADLLLKRRALRCGIATNTLPEKCRIPDEPDPNREKIKELERRLRECEAAVPELWLAFQDVEQHCVLEIEQILPIKEAEVDQSR